MPNYRVVFETTIEADAPEDAALICRDLIRDTSSASIFLVHVPDGVVAVDTEDANESVARDDRKTIGPVVFRHDGPTGVITSPVMARHYEHTTMESETNLGYVGSKQLLVRGCGDEAFYEWVAADGSLSEPFAVITVKRQFNPNGAHPAVYQTAPMATAATH